MKMPFLLPALLAILAIPALAGTITQSCGNDTSKIEPTTFSFALPDGDTESDIRQPFSLDRLECAFLSEGSFRLERVRSLESIPYIDHRTNDGAVVGWKVTSGTTFDDRDEAFAGPLTTYEGDRTVYHADKMTSSRVYRVDASAVQWFRPDHEVGGTRGFGPCVCYSFASNALYLSSVEDSPERWTRLGDPGKFSYGSCYRQGEGSFLAIVNNETGVTNFLDRVADRRNTYSSILFEGVTLPTSLAGDADGTAVPVSFVPGHTVTNFAVWSTCSMTVTDTLVSTNAGKRLDVSLKDVVVLPNDVLRVSGSAMPAGHVIGIGRK